MDNPKSSHYLSHSAGSSAARTAVIVVCLLAAYGSLYPLQFAVPDRAAWTDFVSSWGGRSSLGDLFGNLALFAPLGLFAYLALPTHTSRAFRVMLVMTAALAFSTSLQVAQLFVPARIPAMIDVVWNGLGTALGIALAIPLALSTERSQPSQESLPLPLLLLAFWALSELAPLVPSLDFEALKDSFKPLLLTPQLHFVDAALAATSVLAAGHLLSALRGKTASVFLLCLLVLAIAIGKIVVLTQVISVSMLVGWASAVFAWSLSHGWTAGDRAKWLAVLLILTYTIAALHPFELRTHALEFNWVPFADVLTGSMLNNINALMPRLFAYAMLLWLCPFTKRTQAAIGLALWALLLEGLQTLLVGRIATISEPLWIALIAFLLARSDNGHRDNSKLVQNAPPPVTRALMRSRLSVVTALTVVSIAAAVWLTVRLPGVPYNLRELLHGQAGWLSCIAFALASLWWGAGSVLVAERVNRSNLPPLAWLAWGMLAGLVSLLVISLSVTEESISDIAGTNNLFYFVTEYGIWGEVGRSLFHALPNSEVVAFFERPVRYAALFGPLFTFLAMAHLATDSSTRRPTWPRLGWLMLAAIPWLWLCKGIAFDTSSTDNLNELIARPGTFGMGGGGYLYLALAVLAFISGLLAAAGTARAWSLVVALTLLSLPCTWWLMELGLETHIHKYGMTYSGLQFLLGPDRRTVLPAEMLFARWSMVYLGACLICGAGMRLALAWHCELRRDAHPAPKAPPAVTRTRDDESGFKVRLAQDNLEFLNALAERRGQTLTEIVGEILMTQLNDLSSAELHDTVRASRANRLASGVDHEHHLSIVLAEQPHRQLTALADDANISLSRASRRLVNGFVEAMTHPSND